MDDICVATINAALPPEILYEAFLFVGHGRMPCMARMVCRWWRDVIVGGDPDARLLRAPEALDLLDGDLAPEPFVARAAWTMTLVAPPGGDCALVFRHLCAVLGRAGRWQQVLVRSDRHRASSTTESLRPWHRALSPASAPTTFSAARRPPTHVVCGCVRECAAPSHRAKPRPQPPCVRIWAHVTARPLATVALNVSTQPRQRRPDSDMSTPCSRSSFVPASMWPCCGTL
nr:hypothetical protein [Pandoravirus belohorizontensis]